MNEATIKEVKSIYSSKLRSVDPTSVKTDIKSIKAQKANKSFFNGVIEKLNIIVQK